MSNPEIPSCVDSEIIFQECYTELWCGGSDYARQQLRLLDEVMDDRPVAISDALECIAQIKSEDRLQQYST